MKIVFFLLFSILSLPNRADSVACGIGYCLLLSEDNRVWAFGKNDVGQLGLGHKHDVDHPRQISDLANIVSVAAGSNHSLALDNKGEVWAWGMSKEGALGLGPLPQTLVPQKIADLSNITSVYATARHSFALDQEGNLWGFGNNEKNTLRLEGTKHALVPTRLAEPTLIKSMDINPLQSFALCSNGSVVSWGNNIYEHPGPCSSEMFQAFGFENLVNVSVGYHGLFIWNTAAVWGWKPLGLFPSQLIEKQENGFTKIYSPPDIVFITDASNLLALDSNGKLWEFLDEWKIKEGLPPLIQIGKATYGFSWLADKVANFGVWALDNLGGVWFVGVFFDGEQSIERIVSLNQHFAMYFIAAKPKAKIPTKSARAHEVCGSFTR